MNTTIFIGERETLAPALSSRGYELIDCESPLYKRFEGKQKQHFERAWQARALIPHLRCFINPPPPAKDAVPNDQCVALFEPGHSNISAWRAWAKAFSDVDLQVAPVLTPEQFTRSLVAGGYGIPFSPEAATWYVNVCGTSIGRARLECSKLRLLDINQVTLEVAQRYVLGAEDLRAIRLVTGLGQRSRLNEFSAVPETQSFSLLTYAERAMSKKNPKLLLLIEAIRASGVQRLITYDVMAMILALGAVRLSQGERLDDLLEELFL